MSACNSHTNYGVTTFVAPNPVNGVITKVTNINDGKASASPVIFNNSAVLNSASLLLSGEDARESVSDVILSDTKSGEYGSALWIFNGKEWIKQTGESGQPPSVHKIYGKPTASSVILKSRVGSDGLFSGPREAIWIYDGKSWSKQTGGTNQPFEVEEIYGTPALTSIILKSKASTTSGETHEEYLWVYNGKTWSKQTGGVNQPSSIREVAKRPTANSILLIDKYWALWAYNGRWWNKLSGGTNQPAHVDSIYGEHPGTNFVVIQDKLRKLWIYNGKIWNAGYGWKNNHANVDYVFDIARPDFLAVKDAHSVLWVYNGKSWSRQTGGVSQPKNIDNLVGYQYSNSMVLKDSDANLWVYNGKSWSRQTGGASQPQSVDRIFGNPTVSSIVLQDSPEQNLWVYNGKTWSQQTGLSNQPKAVNVPFMVHQLQLQQ